MKLILFLVFFSYTVYSNDSSGERGIGGELIAAKSQEIEMLSEDLLVTLDKITVKYKFKNTSNKDIKTTVYFPIKLVPGIDYNTNIKLYPTYDPKTRKLIKPEYGSDTCCADFSLENPHQFSLLINKKVSPFQLDFPKDGKQIDELKYFWETTFPANKEVEVEHSYVPDRKNFPGGDDPVYSSKYYTEDKNFCIDRSTAEGIKQKLNIMKKDKSQLVLFSGNTLTYILKTAKNWNGPIKKFRLTVKKKTENELVSYCIEGVKKVDPLTFVVEKTNFVPQNDLDVLWFSYTVTKRND